MKIKSIFTSLILLFIVLIVYIFILKLESKNNIQAIVDQSVGYHIKNKYLERCLNYHKILADFNFDKFTSKKLLVYFTGESCGVCVESLLKLLSEEDNLKDKVFVYVDDIQKEEFILNLNDRNEFKFEYYFDKEKLLPPLNEVLLLRLKNGRVRNILEFRPAESNIFYEYFKKQDIKF